MAVNFPLSLDSLSNPSSGDKLDNPSHSIQHGDANDILEALETKLGIGASPAGSATAGFPLVHSSGGTTAWAQVGYEGITSGTATSGQVLTAGTATGTTTWTTPIDGGLIQIIPSAVTVTGAGSSGSVSATGAVTFGTATSIYVANTFSSTYENYRIVINITGVSTQMDILMRLNASGTDNTSAVYSRGGVFNYINSTPTALASVGDTKWQLGFVNSGTGSKNAFGIDVFRPNIVAETTAASLGVWNNNVTFAGFFCGYLHDSAASFNGFTVSPNTGTINSGTIRIYGYRN
jgi:hypothetical protein